MASRATAISDALLYWLLRCNSAGGAAGRRCSNCGRTMRRTSRGTARTAIARSRPVRRPTAMLTGPRLNERYTFETFVEGENNRLAFAACNAAAERPGETYNPLFIYGGVGLGKTHLLHAMGQAMLARGKRVIYVTSEQFTNDFVAAI